MESHGGRSWSLQLYFGNSPETRVGGGSSCDAFPPAKQLRCVEVWKDLYKEDRPAIAQFGLDQLKRREEGKITPQQHLAQNMDFIKQATERRLARLNERMAKE